MPRAGLIFHSFDPQFHATLDVMGAGQRWYQRATLVLGGTAHLGYVQYSARRLRLQHS